MPLEIRTGLDYSSGMKISGYGTIKPTNTTRRTGSSGSASSFSSLLNAAQSSGNSASAVSNIAATTGLDNILALQEISEEERKRERAVKHGKDMLESLEKLRRQLLMGEIPHHMLGELAQKLAEQKQEIADPRLMDVLEDIELRVAVELAKLEMAFASRAQIE